jgi:hypothetical protein
LILELLNKLMKNKKYTNLKYKKNRNKSILIKNYIVIYHPEKISSVLSRLR